VSPERTAILGAIAGFTIFFGLPIGRLQGLGERSRAFLSVLAAGILLFIFWDVLDAAHGILESGLLMAKAGQGWGTFAARAAMAAVAAEKEQPSDLDIDRMVAGLIAADPGLCDDVLFGASAVLLVEGRFAAHLVNAWSSASSSLLPARNETG